MGYDIHITRKENWFDENGPVIGIDEWHAMIKGDPEMQLEGFAEAQFDAKMLRIDDPSLAVWTAYSKHGLEGNMAWFRLNAGNVDVKNPDTEIRVKMFKLATALKAKLQGDEGEFYSPSGEPIEPDAAPSKPRWKIW